MQSQSRIAALSREGFQKLGWKEAQETTVTVANIPCFVLNLITLTYTGFWFYLRKRKNCLQH